MAKFIYRMQSILDIKQKLEEQAKNEFAKARLQLTLEEDKLQKLKEEKMLTWKKEENSRKAD